MYSVLAFITTLAQLIVVFGSYAMQAQEVFAIAAVYGAPPYLVMNLLNADSAFNYKTPIFIVLFVYHLAKYFCFFRARIVEGGNFMLTAAVIFEAAYLGISGYYML
jgi:hypothetical protein